MEKRDEILRNKTLYKMKFDQTHSGESGVRYAKRTHNCTTFGGMYNVCNFLFIYMYKRALPN